MKYLTAIHSTVGSIKNLARGYFAYVKAPIVRGQASGRLKGYLLLADQNAELKELIQELENQVKLRDRLLSIVSHDTRAPLNSLKSTLHLLSTERLSPSELPAITLDLTHQLEQLSGFLENLLQWTKNHHDQIKPNKENLFLRPLVMETLALLSFLAYKKQVRMHCLVPESESVYGDAEMLKVILRNLISNAIKFCDAQDTIFIQAYQIGNDACISVSDTGTGISKEHLKQLFRDSSLSTRGTKNEIGTGLGLVLCREFVEKHGGKIQASSAEGKGSRFEFTLPHAMEEQQPVRSSR